MYVHYMCIIHIDSIDCEFLRLLTKLFLHGLAEKHVFLSSLKIKFWESRTRRSLKSSLKYGIWLVTIGEKGMKVWGILYILFIDRQMLHQELSNWSTSLLYYISFWKDRHTLIWYSANLYICVICILWLIWYNIGNKD